MAEQQSQRPGIEAEMSDKPQAEDNYRGSGKLDERVALITGGDSGIGRAVAVAFAKEGAHVAIAYLEDEEEDAQETKRMVEKEGRRCFLVTGDIGREENCQRIVRETIDALGQLHVLVNNAAEQHPQESILDISAGQLERTFRTNIFSMFFLVKAALPYMKKGAAIVNTASVTAYKGNPQLLDYSSTKGAIVAFTRALSNNLVEKGIRVNAVAPGPIWTPLIPSTFPPEKVESFGKDVPMGRPGQPVEVAKCFVFLASDDSSYLSGQVLHPNGGTVVNG